MCLGSFAVGAVSVLLQAAEMVGDLALEHLRIFGLVRVAPSACLRYLGYAMSLVMLLLLFAP